jgi:hypothetical protein
MNAPLYVTPPAAIPLPDPPPLATDVADLLRQLLDVQREQVALLRAQQVSQDNLSRWRAFLGRWAGEFPNIGGVCKQVLPAIERAYLTMVRDLTQQLQDSDNGLEDEFVLGEFLDRYGIRLNQLGSILSQLSPLADAAPQEGSGVTE